MTESLTLSRRAALTIAGAAVLSSAVPAFAQDMRAVEEMSIGADDAPITVIEYASFTCPHCANFHTGVYQDIKENYIDSGKVRMVFRPVYFDRLGLWADMMARCGGQDRFVGIAGMIYEKQREWTAGEGALEIINNLYAIGRLAGMNDDDMEACMQDNEFAQALVKEATANAESDNINATPTFVINGEVNSNMSYKDFAQIFDEILGE